MRREIISTDLQQPDVQGEEESQSAFLVTTTIGKLCDFFPFELREQKKY